MIPRLTRFYGRAPGPDGDWLKVKPHILNMYCTMLPRLEAEEALDGITGRLASESRMLEDNSRTRYMSALERRAAGQRKPKVATAADLAGMGIKIVQEGEG